MSIIEATKQYVQTTLKDQEASHDWWHINRVYEHALDIADQMEEVVDKETIALAALLHDIADWKFTNGDETIGPKKARIWLQSQAYTESKIDHVCDIIASISFKGASEVDRITTIEGKIVQDADRLDAIGAIGIARTFAYGGYAGQAMYDPTLSPQEAQTKAQYQKQETTAINHFYEKLLLLKDRMHTDVAKEMAAERHQYMVDFLGRFLQENYAEETKHFQLLEQYR